MAASSQPPDPKTVKFRGFAAPLAGSAVLMNGYDASAQTGTMRVVVDVGTAGVVKVVATTIAVGATMSDTPPTTGLVELPHISGGQYGRNDFTVYNLPQAGPFADNKQLCYWGLDGADRVVEKGDPIVFAAVPNPCTGTVAATHCIWLTYAPPGQTVSTFNEHTNAGSPYLPWGVWFPGAARQARVQATSAGPWAHSPDVARESGPGGLDGTGEDLAAAHTGKYVNDALRSRHIHGQSLKLNLLVGLREYRAHDDAETTEVSIGTDSTLDKRPTGVTIDPYRLRLAMHDGYEWSNNHGSVSVTVTWIV